MARQGGVDELQMFGLPRDVPATVEDFVRLPRPYPWSQAAARQPELMFGDGDTILYMLNRGKWRPGKGNAAASARNRFGTVNRAQFVRALDVKVCTVVRGVDKCAWGCTL